MTNLDIFLERLDIQFVKTFVGVRRKVSQRNLLAQQRVDFFQKRIEADRRAESLEESLAACLVR